MSVVATAHATDEDLLALGITKRGDLICLRRFCMEKIQKSESKERLKEKKGLLEKVLERNKSKRRFEASNGLPHKKSRGKAPGGSGTKKYRLGGCITVTSRKGIFLLDKTRVVVPETFMFHLLQQQT